MKLFAISDLHLSAHKPKSMDIFGSHWCCHWEKIQADWREKVSDEDVVLVCGDLSWAMRLPEALPDLEEICRLPGKKVLLRGNHDYWWSSASKVQACLFKRDVYFAEQSLCVRRFPRDGRARLDHPICRFLQRG